MLWHDLWCDLVWPMWLCDCHVIFPMLHLSNNRKEKEKKYKYWLGHFTKLWYQTYFSSQLLLLLGWKIVTKWLSTMTLHFTGQLMLNQRNCIVDSTWQCKKGISYSPPSFKTSHHSSWLAKIVAQLGKKIISCSVNINSGVAFLRCQECAEWEAEWPGVEWGYSRVERSWQQKWGNNLGLSSCTVPWSAVVCVVAYFRRSELLSGDQERNGI